MRHCHFYALVFLVLISGCTEQHLPVSSTELASKGLYSGAISSDGQWVFAGSIFQGGSLWRTNDNERLFNWNHTSGEEKSIILSADIDASNTRAITADDATLVLWDMNTGEASRFWTSPAKILDVALINGGQYAALALADQSAVIFDAVNGGITRTLRHMGRVRSIAASEDKRFIITGSEDRTAVIWQFSSGEPLFTITHEEEVQFVTLSKDGRYALTASQYDKAELWDTESQQSLGAIPMKKHRISRGLRVTAATFSDDNTLLLLAYPNRTIELRRVDSLAVVDTWTIPKRSQWQPTAATIIDLAFDKQPGKFLALASDGFLHRLELAISQSP